MKQSKHSKNTLLITSDEFHWCTVLRSIVCRARGGEREREWRRERGRERGSRGERDTRRERKRWGRANKIQMVWGRMN